MPKLSVVIPVYNARKYLPECVDSVLAQTYFDTEIILVDDGSSDGSDLLCDDLAARNKDIIRVIHQENGGASSARNSGLRAARGDYVHFIDSDDMLSRDTVYADLMVRAEESLPEIIFFRRERFIDGQKEIDAIQPAYEVDGAFDGDVLNHVLSKRYQLTLTCPVNKIFSRDFLIKNDLFFTVGLDHEEDEWLPRVIACAHHVRFDKGIYYKVRNHPDSLSQTTSESIKTRRACSKITIAATGVAYMEQKNLSPDTMALITTYYWDYLTDACVTCNRLRAAKDKDRIYQELKKNRRFFDSRKYLKSRNRRVLGMMFKTIGVKLTVIIIGIRYGK